MADNIITGIVDGLITLCVTIFGIFVRSHNARLKDIEIMHRQTDKDLSEHKLYTEKTFETKDSSHASIVLIRQAVDDVRTMMSTGMAEVRGDIKEILQRLPK